MNKQFNRQRRHNNNNRSRSVAMQQITRFTNLDSSGPLGKLRGTPLQLVEKYQAGAKDAQMQGDDVLFQTCQQYADHYMRLQAIAIENEQAKIKTESVPTSDTATEISENSSSPSEESTTDVGASPVIVEKKTAIRRKKVSEDSLSMPMDALHQKSDAK